MGLLKSVDNDPSLDYYDYREGQYYGKYEYRMRVTVPGVRAMWFCKTPDDLDVRLNGSAKNWRNIRKEDRPAVTANRDAIKALITLQEERKKTKDLGLRVEGTTVALFCNDLQRLKDLEPVIGSHLTYDYTQIQTTTLIGTKHFVKEPKHKYRVYLKSKRISDTFVPSLRKIIDANSGLQPSNALRIWMKDAMHPRNTSSWRYRFCSSSYFIDYDDESMLSYLALMHDGMLGKRYKLEKRPDPV